MMDETWKTWEAALDAYCYPVDLTDFEGRDEYPGWFQLADSPLEGDRTETAAFEKRFRENAEHDLGVWYEVVFWKMYSQSQRRNPRTQEVIDRFRRDGTTAGELWDLCMEYIVSPSRDSFIRFKSKIHEPTSPMVATAATFPAFICPTRFPMIDRHVVRWARKHGHEHNGAHDISIARTWKNDDVRIQMWPFVQSWIEWCRYTAELLTGCSKREWTAREVEMTVFTADLKGLNLSDTNAALPYSPAS